MTDTSSLRAFIEARLADDERLAMAAAELDPSPWLIRDQDGAISNKDGFTVVHIEDSTPEPATAQHIARHDPARVLREVAAKRAILADLDRARAQAKQHPKDFATTGWMLGMMRALGYLALVWSDHPDFDPSWTSWSTA